jgi:hypothetical protein
MPALRRANELASATTFPGMKRQVTVSKVLHRLARNVRTDLGRNRRWLEDLTLAYPVRGAPMPLTLRRRARTCPRQARSLADGAAAVRWAGIAHHLNQLGERLDDCAIYTLGGARKALT